MRQLIGTGNDEGGQMGNVVEDLREEIRRLVKEEAKLREEKAKARKEDRSYREGVRGGQ